MAKKKSAKKTATASDGLSELDKLLAEQVERLNLKSNYQYSVSDLKNAGLILPEIGVDPGFIPAVNDGNIGFVRQTLERLTSNIIGQKTWADLSIDKSGLLIRSEGEYKLRFALLIRGCLRLADQHAKRCELRPRLDCIYQAAALWVMQEYGKLTGFFPMPQQRAINAKSAKANDRSQDARAEFERRRATGLKSVKTESILQAMANEKNSTGKLKWGSLRTLKRYMEHWKSATTAE